MIFVGMRDEDVRHGFALDGIEQRFGMRLAVRTGIDDRDLAASDDVTHRACEGERRGIVAQHAANAGHDLFGDAGFQRKIAIERDVVFGVGHGGFR